MYATYFPLTLPLNVSVVTLTLKEITRKLMYSNPTVSRIFSRRPCIKSYLKGVCLYKQNVYYYLTNFYCTGTNLLVPIAYEI